MLGALCGKLYVEIFGNVRKSVERYPRHNPLDPYSPTFPHHCLPHFTTAYGVADSENPTFSPLTIAGRPVFYYVYFPAKKGRLSIMSGE